jgi:drug/metabolite transporter (DMT)-like permease
MPFYIYAWIATILAGCFVIIAKLTSKRSITNPWLFNFLLTIVTFVITVPIALFNHAGLPNNWLPIILAAFFYTLFNTFYFISNKNLDVSIFMPLFNFRSIFAVILGAVFFKETFSGLSVIFIIIIFIAGIFSSMDEKFSFKSFFKKTIAIGLFTTLILAINNAFTKQALISNSLWTTNLWTSIFNVLFIIPTVSLFKKDLNLLKVNHIFPVSLMGLLYTLSGFASTIGYKGNLAITTMIMNVPVSMILALLFSVFAPKLLEKHTLKIYAIRFSSAAIMIWAAMQLSK